MLVQQAALDHLEILFYKGYNSVNEKYIDFKYMVADMKSLIFNAFSKNPAHPQ
jgi:hypothetical protein